MRLNKNIFLLTLLILPLSVFSQASWSYTIHFNIYDQEDRKFLVEDFLNGDIEIYGNETGVHKNTQVYYNAELECFSFSQNTIVTRSILTFKVKDEIMFLKIPTNNLTLEKIKFEPGSFEIPIWDGKEIQKCNMETPEYQRTYSISKDGIDQEHF